MSAGRGFADFCLAVARRVYEERLLQTAGALTFTSLLSLVPLITVILAVATAFPVFDDAIEALQAFVLENFLPEARGVDRVGRQISAFTRNAGRLTAIGLAFFVVTSVMLMMTIDMSLNRVFRVFRQRPLLQQVLLYWAVLTLGPVLIGASLSMTSYAIVVSFGWLKQSVVAHALLAVLPFVFTCIALTFLYSVVPYRSVGARDALVGGIAAGIAFELAKRGFAAYISHFPTYTLIYGAFATIPIFLVWLYVSWLVVLSGAVLTAMLPSYRFSGRKAAPGHEFADALALFTALVDGQDSGRPVRVRELSARARVPQDRCEAVLERSAQLGWTARTDRDGWMLARDADALNVRELYRAFVFDAETWDLGKLDFEQSLRQYAAAKEKKEKE